MINCAHPTHFATTLDEETDWVARIRGIRANASRCSHAELDAMTPLDAGDPRDHALRSRARKEERRVGEEGVRTGRCRELPCHYKKREHRNGAGRERACKAVNIPEDDETL